MDSIINWILANLNIILSVFFGFILLLIEALIPGFGITGTLGIILNIVGIYFTWKSFGTLAGIGLTIVVFLAFLIVVSLSVRSARKGRLSKSPLVLSDNEAEPAIEDSSKLVGKYGLAVTDLRPAGIAEIEGKRVDVVTRGDYIVKGSKVIVREFDGPKIIVELIKI
ncbi:MAG: hypothetical protein GYA87_06710 [Christensenellaceae bacterium]|nr:hypothetical protein [Christensenellaceae bacterium]